MIKSVLSIAILMLSTSVVSADLMSEPSGALKGKKHDAYSAMHEGMTNCEQRNDNRWRLKIYPISLKKYNFKDEFYSPFNNRGGASCKAGFTQMFNGKNSINTNLPPLIDANGGKEYGNSNNARSIAMIWWSIATSHVVYDPNSKGANIVRKTLLEWAKNNALSKNIQANYGKKPMEYEVAVIVSRLVETVGAFGPTLAEKDRLIIGPWLDKLVRKLQKSSWLSRQDNKQYLSDYTVTLWAAINNDFKPIEKLANNFKHAVHDMRDDGSIVQESVRGGTTLHYQSFSATLMLKEAALIKNITGVDLTNYRAEGERSLRDALLNLVKNYKNPKAQAKLYGRNCPSASFGTIENPEMNWRKFSLRPALEYANSEHKNLKLGLTASQVKGPSEYASMGNMRCMFTE